MAGLVGVAIGTYWVVAANPFAHRMGAMFVGLMLAVLGLIMIGRSTKKPTPRQQATDAHNNAQRADETCPACNEWNEPDARVCDHCGAELPLETPTEKPCPGCEAANTLDAKFCNRCGRALV